MNLFRLPKSEASLGRRRFLAHTALALAAWHRPILAGETPKMTHTPPSRRITLFLCGDVMTGRGIDQVLPHPSRPHLYEPYMSSAVGYVELAAAANGPIRRPLDFPYIWGDALDELRRVGPDLRIVNLETAVTLGGTPWTDKGIHYRMHPDNVGVLTAAGIDCAVLIPSKAIALGKRNIRYGKCHQKGQQGKIPYAQGTDSRYIFFHGYYCFIALEWSLIPEEVRIVVC